MSNLAISLRTSPVESCTDFDAAMLDARQQLVRLVSALTCHHFLRSWLEAQEVRRAIERAERSFSALPAYARPRARQQLDGARLAAISMQRLVPSPTPLALAQIRSPHRGHDRGQWARERTAWLRVRRASPPPHPT